MSYGQSFLDRPYPFGTLPNGRNPQGTLLGTLAQRPPAGYVNCGYLYYSTDTSSVFLSTGSQWIPLIGTPYLPPYDPRTVPYYGDFWWKYFQGRPFPVSGLYGFTANQSTLSGTVALNAIAAQGAITVTIPTGNGTNLAVGELIVIGDGGVNWQSFLLNNISINSPSGSDTLTVLPRVAQVGGLPIGSVLQHGWGNSSHPSYTYAWDAWGAAIAGTKMRRCDGQPSIMPPNGAGNGNDLGSMADASGNTVGGLSNCPAGWTPVGTAANITSTPTVYAVTSLSPNARNTAAIALQANTASGSGIKTNIVIPVVPGNDYTLSVQAKTNAGNGFKIQVNDFTTPTIILQTYNWSTTSADMNTDSLCARTTMQFTIPGGTTGIQIQLISQAATDNTYFADFRVVPSRQSPLNDRYVIEPTGRPIVMLGDSWTAGTIGSGWSALNAALQARLGNNTILINKGISGQNVNQMVARMATDVLPYYPAYCVLGTGFQNDLAQNRSLSTVQADVASFIDVCRSNGIIPVIPGVAPTSNTSVTGGSSPLDWSHSLNESVRNQIMLVTR